MIRQITNFLFKSTYGLMLFTWCSVVLLQVVGHATVGFGLFGLIGHTGLVLALIFFIFKKARDLDAERKNLKG